jgi:SAM-dependent methyltransferase
MKDLISKISENLIYKDGIWFSKDQSEISYPAGGNEFCFEIEDQSFWFKHRADCILNAVSANLNDKIIFDIGGGNGFTSLKLVENDIDSILVEPGIEGILNAKKRKLKDLICSSFQDAAFLKNSIPNIGIFDVLEHIEQDSDFLKELNTVLSDEGKLFITVPAFKVLWSKQDEYSGHYRRYTLSNLEAKLLQANFEIVYSSYFFSVLPFPIFLFRTLPSIFNRKRDNTHKAKSQHKSGTSSKLLRKIWNKEISMIKKKKKIRFGSSCIVIAKKKPDGLRL